MVQHRTMLEVADNTGAKLLQVIQIYGGSKRRKGALGSMLGCVVKKTLPNTQFKKGDKVKVVLVRTRKEFKRPDGTYIRFSENSAAVVNAARFACGVPLTGVPEIWQMQKNKIKILQLSRVTTCLTMVLV